MGGASHMPLRGGPFHGSERPGAVNVPIEHSLRPLLLWLRDRAKGKGLVLPILSVVSTNNLSRDFRQRRLSAGVDRGELYQGSATEKAIAGRLGRFAVRLYPPPPASFGGEHRGIPPSYGYETGPSAYPTGTLQEASVMPPAQPQYATELSQRTWGRVAHGRQTPLAEHPSAMG